MTQLEALQEALYLALIAPDETRAAMATNLAIELSEGLTLAQVDQVKGLVLEVIIASGAA